MKVNEVRKKLAMKQRMGELNFRGGVMINNSPSDTIEELVKGITACIKWEERTGCEITSAELESSHELPDAWFLGRVFGSMPKFLAFLHEK